MFNSNPNKIGGLDKLQVLIGYASWIAVGVLVALTIALGARMAVDHHRGEPVGRGMAGVAAGCFLVGAAGALAGSLLGFNLFTSNPQAIPGLTAVQTVIGAVAYVAVGVCVLGFFIVGIKMAMAHHRGEPVGGGLGALLAGCLVVGSASTIVTAFVGV